VVIGFRYGGSRWVSTCKQLEFEMMRVVEMNLMVVWACEECIHYGRCTVTTVFVTLGLHEKFLQSREFGLDLEHSGSVYWPYPVHLLTNACSKLGSDIRRSLHLFNVFPSFEVIRRLLWIASTTALLSDSNITCWNSKVTANWKDIRMA
jgi:hypothetical protein